MSKSERGENCKRKIEGLTRDMSEPYQALYPSLWAYSDTCAQDDSQQSLQGEMHTITPITDIWVSSNRNRPIKNRTALPCVTVTMLNSLNELVEYNALPPGLYMCSISRTGTFIRTLPPPSPPPHPAVFLVSGYVFFRFQAEIRFWLTYVN